MLILSLTAGLLVSLSACKQGDPNAPGLKFRGKVYATDARRGSIMRAQDGKVDEILATDPRFDGRVVFTVQEYKQHLQDLADLSYQCVQWREYVKPTVRSVRQEIKEELQMLEQTFEVVDDAVAY